MTSAKSPHYKTGQTRVLAIHDLCGVGKCSLTAALPILSAAGIEACAIPTAIFSTHTAFPDFVCNDLTPFLMTMAENLKKQNFHFDAIYTGYLANAEQAGIVSDIISLLAEDDTRIIVDPAMADGGKLYTCLPSDFPAEMLKLTRALAGQDEFILHGQEYKKPKPGVPDPLLEPWYRMKNFSIVHEEPLTEELFSRDIAERLKAGYDFLIPYYRYFVTLDGDADPRE